MFNDHSSPIEALKARAACGDERLELESRPHAIFIKERDEAFAGAGEEGDQPPGVDHNAGARRAPVGRGSDEVEAGRRTMHGDEHRETRQASRQPEDVNS